MLGYLALTQSSHVKKIIMSECEQFHLEDTRVEYTNTDEVARYLQFCGHAMHFHCFDPYFANTVHRSETQDDLIIDTLGGEFNVRYVSVLAIS